MMGAPSFARIEELFHRARILASDEREQFLEVHCSADAFLRAQVEALLAHHDRPSGILQMPLPEALSASPSAPGGADEVEAGLPARIGRYRILGGLGSGGMGIVYRAVDEHSRREVALKVLRRELATTKFLRRFKREAKVIGRLRHPGIARAYEAGTTPGSNGSLPFFVMELVDGLPLHEHAEQRRLDIRQRVELLLKVCEGVAFAHHHGVVHCDLKPKNILVQDDLGSASPSLGQPKILDFGVARVTADDVHSASMHTGTGHLAGTLPYMSPEQLRSVPSEIDARSDVYALGVLAYQLLSGKLPHDVAELPLLEAARVIRDEDPSPLGAVNPALGGDLEAVVAKALDTQPEHRYATVRAFAADLRRWLHHEPVRARPPGMWRRTSKFARRHPTLSTAMGLGGAALLAVTILLLQTIAAKRVADARAREAELERQRAMPLSDALVLTGLVEQAEELWPARPSLIDAYDAWLREAQRVLDRLPVYRAALAAPAGVSGAVPELDKQPELVRRLESFDDATTGLYAEVRRRRAVASTLWQRSMGDFTREWEQASAAIAGSAKYHGLELGPQLGLVPLGADPASGLWEFWHVCSGAMPQRDPETGRLVITTDTGIVLVLLPRGRFWIGSQDRDPEGPNYDPQALPAEEPRRVTLDAFFLSKYEMTQGQWERVMRANPSWFGPDRPELGPAALLHPVEQVSWRECSEALRRLDLVLPTEAQWEYGARGGTTTPWWSGADAASLRLAGNLADRSYGSDDAEPWDDGHPRHAPVGSFAPNAFGLHDVAGNVLEWCRDEHGPYIEFQPGDGRLVLPESRGLPSYATRGGSWYYPSGYARVARRAAYTPGSAIANLGVRPARQIEQ